MRLLPVFLLFVDRVFPRPLVPCLLLRLTRIPGLDLNNRRVEAYKMVKAAQEEMDVLLEEQERKAAVLRKQLSDFEAASAAQRHSVRMKRKKAELLLENIDLKRARSLERELKSIEEFDQLRAERDKVLEAGAASSESGAGGSSEASLGLMPSEFLGGFPEGSGLTQDPNGDWNFLQFPETAGSPVES